VTVAKLNSFAVSPGSSFDEEFAGVRAALAASAPTQPTPATAPATDTPIRINADEVASRTLALLRQRRDAAAAQGHEALTDFLERQQFNLEDAEAVLRGELEPLHPLSKHEGHRNALRAFLTGDGSVKELPEHLTLARPERQQGMGAIGCAKRAVVPAEISIEFRSESVRRSQSARPA
jgi:hypothetical protein